MSTFIRTWTGGMIYTAMLCGVLTIITPEGRVKNVVKLLCGIAVVAAIISPLVKADIRAYSAYLAEYRLEAERITKGAQEDSKNLNRSYIEEKCEAYILDKAKNCGTAIYAVKVRAEWSTEGFWYPVSAEISSDAGSEERLRLSGIIEAELGIAADEQRWSA